MLTLNLGTKRLNSWCQLLSVDAGEMMRNGPQILSLCTTQNTHTCERLCALALSQDVLAEHSMHLPATNSSAESTHMPGIDYFWCQGAEILPFLSYLKQ